MNPIDVILKKGINDINLVPKESFSTKYVSTERLDVYYVYIPDVFSFISEKIEDYEDHSGISTLFHYVAAVAFLKGTETIVGYAEIREVIGESQKGKLDFVSIPWFFLEKEPFDFRGQGFMLELLKGLVADLRKSVSFYATAKILSGTCLSNDAKGFFENQVKEGNAKEIKPFHPYSKDCYSLTF